MNRRGRTKDTKEVNIEKYKILFNTLETKFPDFDFSKAKVDVDTSRPPTKGATNYKHSVHCPNHGWFKVNLSQMRIAKFGCKKCSREKVKEGQIPLNNRSQSYEDVLKAEAEDQLKKTASSYVQGWHTF